MKNRVTFKEKDVIIVITSGKTRNKKIAPENVDIIQTYTYSREQFFEAQNKTTMQDFFALDSKNCMDCPFAVSNGAKLQDCYTHKLNQYMGFLSQLRSIKKEFGDWDNIPPLNWRHKEQIVAMSFNKYIRFGTYGEPSLIPMNVLSAMVWVAKSWTGYTHQWRKKPEYAAYLMASNHSIQDEVDAKEQGWRSFVASTETNKLTSCPASKEMNFKSNCAKCGLCSGLEGKGNKSVSIQLH
jgi:hypothetical protein